MPPTTLPLIVALLAFCTLLSCALGGRDLYEILGVPRDASKRAIKKEYHRLARRYHPDKNPGDAKMEKRFKDISRAYEVLSDDEQRARYDAYGEEALNNGGEGGGGGGHGGFHFGGGNMGGFQMHFDEATFQDMFNMGMGMGGARAGSHDSGSFFGGWGGFGAGRQREQPKMKVCNDDKICENSRCYTQRTCKTS